MVLRRVLVAVALGALALVATVFGPELRLNAPYLLPMAAVMTAAWHAGLWSGLLTSLITLAGLVYYVLPPPFSFAIARGGDVFRLALFALVSLVMSIIIERGRRTAATLQATLASIDDAVIVTDLQARVTFMNPVAERLTGWTLREAAGRSVADVYRTREDASREPSSSRIEGMLRDGVLREGTILGRPKERLLLSVDAREYPVVDSVSSIVDENGDRTGAVLVFRDVSDQRAARQAAERANRTKDEFLATLSHELRTPLNAVLGWTRMLRTGSMAATQTARAIEAVDRNAEALATLVNDLLDVSRIVTGRLRLAPEATDVAHVVRESLETLGPSIAAKRLQLRAEIEPVPLLLVDAHRMRQVVWNLLSNAIKFTPAGGELAVQVGRDDGSVHIVVSDAGQGIAPEQLPFIFNRFWQADTAPTRTVGGLGLGLAIVRHLVEAHAGTVSADSAGLGQGATFTVSLPLSAAVPDETSDGAIVAGSRDAEAGSLAGLRVMAVDDEIDSLDLIAAALRSHGAEVRTAQSVDEAVRACGDEMPDVIVADIGLPGKDGYALLRELRERGLSTVRALALTAYAGDSHRRAALEAGFTDHLEKPVNPDHLANRVAAVARPQLL